MRKPFVKIFWLQILMVETKNVVKDKHEFQSREKSNFFPLFVFCVVTAFWCRERKQQIFRRNCCCKLKAFGWNSKESGLYLRKKMMSLNFARNQNYYNFSVFSLIGSECRGQNRRFKRFLFKRCIVFKWDLHGRSDFFSTEEKWFDYSIISNLSAFFFSDSKASFATKEF